MRNLDRDRRVVHIARFGELEPVKDEQGRYTGKHAPKRSEPVAFMPTISAARGEASTDYFGNYVDYDRTLTIDDPAFDVAEADVIWIDRPTSEPHDYVVKRVACTSAYTVIAVKRVEVSK